MGFGIGALTEKSHSLVLNLQQTLRFRDVDFSLVDPCGVRFVGVGGALGAGARTKLNFRRGPKPPDFLYSFTTLWVCGFTSLPKSWDDCDDEDEREAIGDQ